MANGLEIPEYRNPTDPLKKPEVEEVVEEKEEFAMADYYSNTMIALSVIGAVIGVVIAYRMQAKWYVYVLLWFVGGALGGAVGRLVEKPKAFKDK